MKQLVQNIHPIFFLIVATVLEVSGDALIRKTIYEYSGVARLSFGFIGVVLLFGYGFFLNLAPVEFGKVVGLYIATLFVVWQVINYIAFRTLPTLPIVVGGTLVVLGGLIITFWKS
jgi:small multidrug resistance family-3 protein